MNTWYIMRVALGKERKLEERLNQKIVNGEYPSLVRFVCPVEKEYYNVNGKKHIRDRVIYGGYLYVECETPISKEMAETIATETDIRGFLGGERPSRLPKTDVERIIKDEVLEQRIASKQAEIEVGTKVHINEGAFIGFIGDIYEINNDKVKVIVKFFGRETVVDLALNQIHKYD